MDDDVIVDSDQLKWKAGSSILIGGASGSGKTQLIKRCLLNKKPYFSGEPCRVHYYYTWPCQALEELGDELKSPEEIIFHKNSPTEFLLLSHLKDGVVSANDIAVVDDYQGLFQFATTSIPRAEGPLAITGVRGCLARGVTLNLSN